MMGSIYIIRSKDLSLHDIYVGSCKDFRKRMCIHKYNCCNEKYHGYNLKLYKFIRANGGWDNFCMEEIDTCDVERLRQTEQEYIDKLNPSLNELRAYRSEEYCKEYQQNWKKNNRDRINQWARKRYDRDREKCVERVKKYNKENKDKIKEKRMKKINCDCGSIVSKSGISEHKRTIKHKNYIQSLSSS